MDDLRIQKLAEQLDKPCLIEDPTDLFYLTHLQLSKGKLLISSEERTLFVDGRYYERAKKEAPCSVLPIEAFKKTVFPEIYFDSAFLCYDSYLLLKKEFPKTAWLPKPKLLKSSRLIKEPQELQALKKAAHLTRQGIHHLLSHLHEGVSEEELALEFEIFCRKKGASALSFEPIIAFGENGAYPHYRAGKSRLKKGETVLIDVGAVVDFYHGDMTRIFHFGTPDPRIARFEEIVQKAQEKAISQIRPGIPIGHLDQIVRDEFSKHEVLPLYLHSLGHGIGLQTHEFPRLLYNGEDKETPLQPGMVFTIEPGLYQPGVGGIRIEDMIVVTESGYDRL